MALTSKLSLYSLLVHHHVGQRNSFSLEYSTNTSPVGSCAFSTMVFVFSSAPSYINLFAIKRYYIQEQRDTSKKGTRPEAV